MKKPTRSLWTLLLVGFILFAAGCAPSATQTAQPPVLSTSTPAAAAPTATSASSGSTTASGSIAYTIDSANSTAGYRVREQLARLKLPSDAVGTTKQISGTITVKPDGSIDASNSKITVDLSTLQTDSSMRDGYVGRSILHTDQYPNAVFVPTQISGLTWPVPTSGSVSFKVTGNLTIRDVTKPVTWDVTGTIQNDTATGLAKTSFKFEDFNLSQPQVPVVLSVVDNIALEINLTLKRAAQ